MKLKSKYLLSAAVIVILFWLSFLLFSSDLPNGNQDERIFRKEGALLDRTINLNELFHMAKCLLKEAGDKIVKIRQETELKLDRKERDNSIVTKADLESHTILVHTLSSKFKNLKINSEENDDVNRDFNLNYYLSTCDNYKKQSSDLYAPLKDINVWIDPLDATQEYSGRKKRKYFRI